jgi:hypothetical protein
MITRDTLRMPRTCPHQALVLFATLLHGCGSNHALRADHIPSSQSTQATNSTSGQEPSASLHRAGAELYDCSIVDSHSTPVPSDTVLTVLRSADFCRAAAWRAEQLQTPGRPFSPVFCRLKDDALSSISSTEENMLLGCVDYYVASAQTPDGQVVSILSGPGSDYEVVVFTLGEATNLEPACAFVPHQSRMCDQSAPEDEDALRYCPISQRPIADETRSFLCHSTVTVASANLDVPQPASDAEVPGREIQIGGPYSSFSAAYQHAFPDNTQGQGDCINLERIS